MTQPYGFGRLASAVAAVLVPIATSSGPVHADGEAVRVRGTVVSIEGPKLVVHAKDGTDVAIMLADKFRASRSSNRRWPTSNKAHSSVPRRPPSPIPRCDHWRSSFSRIA